MGALLLQTYHSPPSFYLLHSSHTELLLLESTLFTCTLGFCTCSALGLEEFAFLPSTHQSLAWGKGITHGCKNWETLTVWLGRVSFDLSSNKLSSRQAMAGRVSQRRHLGLRLSPFPALQHLQPSCFATSWLQNGCFTSRYHVSRHGCKSISRPREWPTHRF